MVCIVRAEDHSEMLWKARGEEGADRNLPDLNLRAEFDT